MCEILWSDPQPQPGRGPSKRGVGLAFGEDVTKRFLQENNLGKNFFIQINGYWHCDSKFYSYLRSILLDILVRSHEVKDEGYEIEHDGKLITVFSAPNYCDQVMKLLIKNA